MALQDYFSLSAGYLHFDKQRSSTFAKEIAGDFNPIHNPNSKRFCVPGDLLFTVFLHRYGIYRSMQFTFAAMVGENARLLMPQTINNPFSLCDTNGKNHMNVTFSGKHHQQSTFIENFTYQYVQFSGRTFPHILVDLMKNNNVMINPDRPMVVYKSMHITLDSFTGRNISLTLNNTRLDIEGKKGEALLQFSINADGNLIGWGKKCMLLSGLRPYQQAQIDAIVDTYAKSKSAYHNT